MGVYYESMAALERNQERAERMLKQEKEISAAYTRGLQAEREAILAYMEESLEDGPYAFDFLELMSEIRAGTHHAKSDATLNAPIHCVPDLNAGVVPDGG